MKKPKLYLDRAGQWQKTPTVPRTFEVMPFQKKGIEWLNTRQNSLLADDMGLGKTCQAIGVIDQLPETARVLIICPAGLRINWLRELSLWLTKTRRCQIAKNYIPSLPVVIVQYDALAKFEVQLRQTVWDLVICDEAHTIKNAYAVKCRQVLGDEWIKPLPAKRRILLTGTPMLNRPIELWTLLRFLGLKWTREKFGETFCGGGNYQGSTNPDSLARLISPLMLRRMKRDVLTDLPEKSRYVVSLSPAGAANQAIKSEKTFEEQAAGVGKFAGGVGFEKIAALRQATALAKLAMPEVQAILKEAAESSGKVVIFCAHHQTVEKIRALFPGQNVTYTGSHSADERQRAVDKFQNDPTCRVFIGTIGAAGVGITLTSSAHVIFIELDWTPGLMTQAEDRCWRKGQKNAVTIQYLVLAGSIDQRELELNLSKQAIIDNIL